MPTQDRLAEPTLPASPSQADYGAQQFWFQCLPCHGDQGQGLTEEFRMLYPPEERNCWESGCHGPRFYENGWTIPTLVPALVGAGSLQKFPNALKLQTYIKAAMPYQWPGTLDDETAWAITAFLMRENGLWRANQTLGVDNAASVVIVSAPVPLPTATLQATAMLFSQLPEQVSRPVSQNKFLIVGAMIFLLAGVAIILYFLKKA
ncbi:MAG: hypothetical protein CVU44_02625 [Chloroflexi bacterium HGW-Chloroflexi-6]|nr:MAG: hypothetical protein CVU44_02625 [Chloroflexi bacterium HGW-Chloroflexi-6]